MLDLLVLENGVFHCREFPVLYDVLKMIYNKECKKNKISYINIYGCENSDKRLFFKILSKIYIDMFGSIVYSCSDDSLKPNMNGISCFEMLKREDIVIYREYNNRGCVISIINDGYVNDKSPSDKFYSTITPPTFIIVSDYKITPFNMDTKSLYLDFDYKRNVENEELKTSIDNISVEGYTDMFYKRIKTQRMIATALICILYFKTIFPKDISKMIGNYIYKTRYDDLWL